MEEKEIDLMNKIKKQVESQISDISENGVDEDNVDYLYRLVDIHKDISNEDYWKIKEGGKEMRYKYGNYGNDYSEENYGRRRRDSKGRYMERGTGSRYRGEEMLDEMYQNYGEYSENREEYGRGNYGAKGNTMKSLDYMLQSVVDFLEMLEKDATSEEEIELIKKYSRQIGEM